MSEQKGQGITLKIAGRVYAVRATSPEQERQMRLAAEEINKVLEVYDQRFPNKTEFDKLAFVTLNEALGKMDALSTAAATVNEANVLTDRLGNYLANIED